MSVKDFFALFHNGVTKYPLLPPNPGYNPRMVQRPLIDAGNTGRYFLDAFFVPFNSPARGTIPLGNPYGMPRGQLMAVTPQSVGIYGGMGSIPNMPGTSGLAPGFRQEIL